MGRNVDVILGGYYYRRYHNMSVRRHGSKLARIRSEQEPVEVRRARRDSSGPWRSAVEYFSLTSKRSYLLANKLDLNDHDVIAFCIAHGLVLLLSDTANVVKISYVSRRMLSGLKVCPASTAIPFCHSLY